MLPQTQFRIFILLFVIFGSVSLLLSTCGKYWIHASDVYSGLWETCLKSVMDQSKCKDVDTNELYWIPLVRGFMIVGISLLGIALLFFVFLISSPKAFRSNILGFILGVAVILTVVGMSIFTNYNNDQTNSYTYHWSYWLGWVGNLIVAVATGMCIHDARRPSTPYENATRLK